MLARLPEFVELGGDQSRTYVYVANSHDGSMAVTAAATPIRVVRANTLGGAAPIGAWRARAERTFGFRHTGNLEAKFAEARHLRGMTVNYQAQFKALADRLALEPISDGALERRVLRHMWVTDKWTAFNAVAERLDYRRRHTARTNQVQRSFEDTGVKQRALDLVLAA